MAKEYDAIKESVKANPHPSKVYIYAFDDCSRSREMWLAMLSRNLDETTPTVRVNASMLKAPASSVPPTGVIGRWIHAHPSVGRTVTIYRKDGALRIESAYADGSKRDKELVEQDVGGEKRLMLPGNTFGEYYVVGSDGLLREYDQDGLIYTLPKK